MTDFVGFILTIASLAMSIFGIGAYSGWSWAVRPVEGAPAPRWIGGVFAVAGLTFVGGTIVRGEPALAFLVGLLFAVIVGSALRIGTFSESPRSRDDSGN